MLVLVLLLLLNTVYMVSMEHSGNAQTTFWAAIEQGNLVLARKALNQGAKIDACRGRDIQAIHIAAQRGYLGVVQWLKANGADINAANDRGIQPIHYAARSGNPLLVRWLKEHGADSKACTKNGRQPIHFAIRRRGFDTVKLLEACLGDINACTNDGKQPVHFAARRGNIELVRWLKAKGADINASTISGMRPIHYAVLGGHSDIVKLLVTYGADVNACTKGGFQPMHFAAQREHFKLGQLLLTHGADINASNKNGDQPIHLAVRKGSLEVVQQLVLNGADVNAYGYDGQPLYCAALSKNLKLMMWLIVHGAQFVILPVDVLDEFLHKGLVYELLTGNEEQIAVLITAWQESGYVPVAELNMAFPIIVAWGYWHLGASILDTWGDDLIENTLSSALEAAIFHNKLALFIEIYEYLSQKWGSEALISLVEKLLYWAVTRGREEIVGFILKRHFSYGGLGLSLTRIGQELNRRLAYAGLSLEQEATFKNIRELLLNAVRSIRESGILRQQLTPLEPDSPSLARLPIELRCHVGSFLFQPY